MRHTTFRYTLQPTPEQADALARHAGAARFAYNQCLALVHQALDRACLDATVCVPWSGYDLINAFNAWKRSEAAGRRFAVSPGGIVTTEITGLVWRNQVVAQVFEEAAVDLGRALKAYRDSRTGERAGQRVGFPRWKRKGRCRDGFRMRNKTSSQGIGCIRVGQGQPRSVTLPKLGAIRVCEDTRRLRRLLRHVPTEQPGPTTGRPVLATRARILSATISRHGSRWQISVTVEAPNLHRGLRHPLRPASDHGGWVGIDRGLAALVVAATSMRVEVGRWPPPKRLQLTLPRLRRLSRRVSRKQPGSHNRMKANRRLGRLHTRIANQRRHHLHQVSTQLVKTHDRLVIEDLHVAGMLRNRHLARAIADAGWAELARQLRYKQAWRGGQLMVADRWLASSKTCSACGWRHPTLPLDQRIFACQGCGLVVDRDVNAAANLAAWASAACVAGVSRVPDRQAGGRVTNACGEASADHPMTDGGTGLASLGVRDAGEEAGTNARVLVGMR